MIESKYLTTKLSTTMSSGFLLLPTSHDSSGPTLCVHRTEADSLFSNNLRMEGVWPTEMPTNKIDNNNNKKERIKKERKN